MKLGTNKGGLSQEFIFQLVALLLAVIVVHSTYVVLIRPNANAELAYQAEQQANGGAYVPSRSLYVVLKDYEQETCFILALWACAIMAYKARGMMAQRALLQESLLNLDGGTRILPKDARDYTRSIQALPDEQRNGLLPRALLMGLQRFAATSGIQDVATAVKEVCDSEADRLDAELAMVRYIAWAIPSIGFIGTVRGIGAALGQAHLAVEGDIAGVTASLGVAFNSTFIALVISIFMMFLMHQLQLLQERLVLDTQQYCDSNLMAHLQVD